MSDFLRKNVLHNLGLKLIALAMAVGMWLAISRDPIAEVGVTIPIEFHHIPDNLEISSEKIPEAQIRVRGPERLIHRMQTQDVHAEMDLAGVKPGERTFDLTSRQIHVPDSMDVVQVVPSQFQITFDTRLVRQIEIHPRVTGTFAREYRISQVKTNPASITIAGPKQRVEAVDEATTDPIDVTGTMDRGTFVTHAYISDPLVQIVHPEPIHVTVIMEKSSESGNH